MMVLKKKEVIASALVVLIGIAGYLNWSYQDTIRVSDGEGYLEEAKTLGEAEFVSSKKDDLDDAETEETSAMHEYFTEAKLSKDNSRSRALEILNQTAANESFDGDVRKQAQTKILSIAENTEKETVIENLAKAKGYKNISVYIDGDTVEIIVKKDNFTSDDAKTIKEIVTSELDTSAKNIKIIETK